MNTSGIHRSILNITHGLVAQSLCILLLLFSGRLYTRETSSELQTINHTYFIYFIASIFFLGLLVELWSLLKWLKTYYHSDENLIQILRRDLKESSTANMKFDYWMGRLYLILVFLTLLTYETWSWAISPYVYVPLILIAFISGLTSSIFRFLSIRLSKIT